MSGYLLHVTFTVGLVFVPGRHSDIVGFNVLTNYIFPFV